MAGPWFTVLEDGAGWVRMDTITLSDGMAETHVQLELKVALEEEREIEK